MGDYQARFCERLRVKLPLPTRPINVIANAYKDKGHCDNKTTDRNERNKIPALRIFKISAINSKLFKYF